MSPNLKGNIRKSAIMQNKYIHQMKTPRLLMMHFQTSFNHCGSICIQTVAELNKMGIESEVRPSFSGSSISLVWYTLQLINWNAPSHLGGEKKSCVDQTAQCESKKINTEVLVKIIGSASTKPSLLSLDSTTEQIFAFMTSLFFITEQRKITNILKNSLKYFWVEAQSLKILF